MKSANLQDLELNGKIKDVCFGLQAIWGCNKAIYTYSFAVSTRHSLSLVSLFSSQLALVTEP